VDVGVQVQHELRQRPLHAGKALLQHHEARARELGGDLEIHLAQCFAEFEVLLCPGDDAWRAETVTLDIGGLVGPDRHLGERQVGDDLQCREKVCARLLLGRLGLGHPILQRGNLGLERIGTGSVLRGHRLADFLGGRVAALLGGLQHADCRLARVIEADQRRRQGLAAAR